MRRLSWKRQRLRQGAEKISKKTNPKPGFANSTETDLITTREGACWRTIFTNFITNVLPIFLIKYNIQGQSITNILSSQLPWVLLFIWAYEPTGGKSATFEKMAGRATSPLEPIFLQHAKRPSVRESYWRFPKWARSRPKRIYPGLEGLPSGAKPRRCMQPLAEVPQGSDQECPREGGGQTAKMAGRPAAHLH